MTTAIGPLTTVFEAPPSCTSYTPQIYQVHTTGDSYSYVQGPLFQPGSNCFPSGYEPSPSAYYSPGLSCPLGYTAACTNVLTPVETTAVETETAVICCPTAAGIISYTCAGKDNNAPSLGCQMAFSRVKGVIGATVVDEDGKVGSYGVFTESEGLFAAYSIQLRFRSADNSGGSLGLLNVPQTTSASSSSTAASVNPDAQRTTVATFAIPVQTSESTTSPPETKSEGGVSTGAAIGIAIGSAIAGILIVSIIGLFFFLRWRRKRHPPPVPPKERSTSLYNTHDPTMDNNGASLRPGPFELSEEPANRRSRPSQSRRLRMMLSSRSSSSRRTTTRPSTRGRSGVPPIPTHQIQSDPAELEAVVPSSDGSNLSFKSDNRSTPESMSTTGWSTLGQHQRDGVTPMPWI